MRFAILVALLVGCALAHKIIPDEVNVRFMYEQFKREYNKDTTNDAEEFAATFTNARFAEQDMNYEQPANEPRAPVSFDWRAEGAVGPVLDQGACGSCWAFSTIGNVEGQWFRKTGKLTPLSKQQLLDCESVDHGCRGGYPPKTYGAITKMGGLMREADYPYSGTDKHICRENKKKYAAYVNQSIVLPQYESTQATYLSTHGPLSSALNANFLQFYRGGVMHPSKSNCSPSGLNHAVLTVGYGTDGSVPYWTIRNSWGKNWGEQGYFRIYRGAGTCGINRVVSSAIIF